MPTVSTTPLLRFLRAMNPDQREAYAAACGTTVGYLYQMAAQAEPNPRLRLALALVAESRRMHRRVHADALTLDDLLTGPEGGPVGGKEEVTVTTIVTVEGPDGTTTRLVEGQGVQDIATNAQREINAIRRSQKHAKRTT